MSEGKNDQGKAFKVSIEAELYLKRYLEKYNSEKTESGEQNIKVSQVLGSVAFLYERVRNAVEYKREHLLKRNAIERFLKRQIWEKRTVNAKELSDAVIRELTWARYLSNESVSPDKYLTLIEICDKYLQIFKLILTSTTSSKERAILKEWFVKVASSEIEEILDQSIYYSEMLADAVFSWFKKRFEWKDAHNLNEEESDIQIYLAIQRSVAKFDNAGLAYRLLKLYKTDWQKLSPSAINDNFNEIVKVSFEIQKQIDSGMQVRIYRYIQKQSAAFLVLKELIDSQPSKFQNIIENPLILESKVKKICEEKYTQIQKKINIGIRRSIIYIFLTKVIFAFSIEFPYEYFIIKAFNLSTLIINIIIPPTLMFFVGISIRRPGGENTRRIVQNIKSFIYEQDHINKIGFSITVNKSAGLIYKIFTLIYISLFILIFGGITVLLTLLDFNMVGIGVFFVFLSLVLLFAYRVKYTASELSVKVPSEGFLSHLSTNITLPLLNLGFWLSEGFKQINIFTIIMDFLVETPLKKIIRVFEEWNNFIKEKKEDVVEIPS